MRHKQAGPISTFIGGIIFLAAGGALVYFWGWPTIVEARASRSWPSVPGTITVSKVESHSGRKGRRTYSPHIEYKFVVDGTPRTGNRVWITSGSSSNSSAARQTVAKYPVGSETKVYYDPDAPEVSVLHTGTSFSTYLPFGFGGLFFLVGAIMAGTAVFKLLTAAAMIGAAATTAVGQSIVPTSETYRPTSDLPPPGADDDDGIEIT